MADVSKIQIESGTYDIKDAVARDLISNINNKKILFIGDSYLELSNGTTGVIDKFKEISGITNVIYNVYSGTGFVYTVDDKNFVTLLNEVTSDNDVTDIIVGGGYNDQYVADKSDILTAISNFCTLAKTKFPNAKVYIGCIGFTMESTKRYAIYEVYEKYTKCNRYGATYLNGVECVMHDTTLFNGGSDLTHPNENGRNELASAIYQAWKCGYYQMTRPYDSVPLSLSGNVSSSSGFVINAMILNNMTYINQQNSNAIFFFSSHPSYSDIHNVDIPIASLTIGSSGSIVSPWPYNCYPISVTCAIHDANGYRTMNAKILFIGNDIRLRIEDVEDNNWTDIEDLEEIEINSFQGVFPTQML